MRSPTVFRRGHRTKYIQVQGVKSALDSFDGMIRVKSRLDPFSKEGATLRAQDIKRLKLVRPIIPKTAAATIEIHPRIKIAVGYFDLSLLHSDL